MANEQWMSADDIFREFGVSPYVLTVWEKRGLLLSLQLTPSGPLRFDRSDVLLVRDSEGLPSDPFPFDEETKPPQPERRQISHVERPARPVAKVAASGELMLVDEILPLKLEVEKNNRTEVRLRKMQEVAVRKQIGVSRHDLMVEMHQRPAAKVATSLGVTVDLLEEICQLYDVPTPPEDHWTTRPRKRAVRITPMNDLPFQGLLARKERPVDVD